MTTTTNDVQRPPTNESFERQEDRRITALRLAVDHHGAANHAENSIPPRPETVVKTAEEFMRWISGEKYQEVYPDAQDRQQRGYRTR